MTVEYVNKAIPQSEQKKLERLLDHIFGALNWFAYLVKTKEITDEKMIFYFKGSILKWHQEMFLRHMDMEGVNDPNAYTSYKWLVRKYQNGDHD